MKKILLAGIMVWVVSSCMKQGDDLKQLVTWMTGSFSSYEQSVADTAYYDVRLEMKPIWTDRTDGYWFYVEQALATNLDNPYRQRVYHVSRKSANLYVSRVYAIPDPARFINAWNAEQPLQGLSPDSLISRDGCEIMLEKVDDNTFEGSTVDRNCKSTLRGAEYATSRVQIRADEFRSWDRGFDAEGKQVWGAEKGAYIFKRILNQE